MKTTLLITLSFAVGILSLNCPTDDQNRIEGCIRAIADFAQVDTIDKCERLEMGIKCTQDINPECAKNAYFVFTKAFGISFFHPNGPGEMSANETCIHERFDEYFNQNGLCSYQDLQKIYLCKEDKLRKLKDPSLDHWSCKVAKATELCIHEGHKTCMGFFRDQIQIFVRDYQRENERNVPECLTYYTLKSQIQI